MRMQGHYTAAGPHLPRLPRWFFVLLGLAVLALVAAVAMIFVEQRSTQTATQTQPPAAMVARTQPQNRIFADEMAYVPVAQEYALLGENYLPLTRPAPIGVAAPVVRLPAATGAINARILATELSYVPTAQEYAMLGESYLPVAPLAPTAPSVTPGGVNPRILAAEMAAATTYDLSAAVTVPEMQRFEITPRIGPR